MLAHEDRIREASYRAVLDHIEPKGDANELDVWRPDEDCIAWQMGYWRGWIERGMPGERMCRVFASIRDTIHHTNKKVKAPGEREKLADLHILSSHLARNLEAVNLLETAEDLDLDEQAGTPPKPVRPYWGPDNERGEPDHFDDDHPEDDVPVAAHGLVKPVDAPGPVLPPLTRQVQRWWNDLDVYSSVELGRKIDTIGNVQAANRTEAGMLATVLLAYRDRVVALQGHKNPSLAECRRRYPSLERELMHGERKGRYAQFQAMPPEQFVKPNTLEKLAAACGVPGKSGETYRGQVVPARMLGLDAQTGAPIFEVTNDPVRLPSGRYLGIEGMGPRPLGPPVTPGELIERARAIGLDVESMALDGRSLLSWNHIHERRGPVWDHKVARLFEHAMRIEEKVWAERLGEGAEQGANKPGAPEVDRCPKCNGTGNMGYTTHSPCDTKGCTVIANARTKALVDARTGPAKAGACAQRGGWPALRVGEARLSALGEADQTSASLGWPIDRLRPRTESAGPSGR